MSLVTLEKVNDMGLAQVMRMKLESEGIPVHLHSAGFASLFSAALGFSAVRVQVPEGLEQRARAVLDELARDLEGETEDDDPD